MQSMENAYPDAIMTNTTLIRLAHMYVPVGFSEMEPWEICHALIAINITSKIKHSVLTVPKNVRQNKFYFKELHSLL
jgi:hypothetical protein